MRRQYRENRHTDRQTHTQNDYFNPRCAIVKKNIHQDSQHTQTPLSHQQHNPQTSDSSSCFQPPRWCKHSYCCPPHQWLCWFSGDRLNWVEMPMHLFPQCISRLFQQFSLSCKEVVHYLCWSSRVAPLTASRLVALDKCPGVQQIGGWRKLPQDYWQSHSCSYQVWHLRSCRRSPTLCRSWGW